MKKIFICGDSFGHPDLEYGECWVDLLERKLAGFGNLYNLSQVCASNLHISLQILQAISNQADYIIYLATSSYRDDCLFTYNEKPGDLLSRFANCVDPIEDTKNLTSYSIMSLNETTIFNDVQLSFLRKYHKEFFDEDLYIFRSRMIIEGTLATLQNSNIPFIFDQGGFEHIKFTNLKKNYFNNYQKYFSDVNLWDYVDGKLPHRPYYHITSLTTHENVADYYYNQIKRRYEVLSTSVRSN